MVAMRSCVAVTVAAAAVGSGCGEASKADPVRSYFEDIDKVFQAAGPRFQAANETYRKFSDGTLKGTAAMLELRRAELGIEAARQQIATLVPPARARRLHALVLRNYEMNVLMAAETRQLAVFVPRAKDIVRRLDVARKRLRRDLDAARGLELQTTALSSYAGRVGDLRDELRRMNAPPALAAAKETQLRVLTHTRALTLRLVRAIREQDKPAVTRLLGRFGRGGDPDPRRVRWEKGALTAYRQRVAAIKQSAREAQDERTRVIRSSQ